MEDTREHVVFVNVSQYVYIDAEAFDRADEPARKAMLLEGIREIIEAGADADTAVDEYRIEETRVL